MITTNLHNVTSIRVSDLYAERPGANVNLDMTDAHGNGVCVFLNDATLRKLAIEMQRYAKVRENPPVEPKPSYADALFAPVAVEDDGTVPF